MSRSGQSSLPIAAVTKGGAVGSPKPPDLRCGKIALRQRDRVIALLKEGLWKQWGGRPH